MHILSSLQRGITSSIAATAAASPLQFSITSWCCLNALGNRFRDHNPKLFALYHKVQLLFTCLEGILAISEGVVALVAFLNLLPISMQEGVPAFLITVIPTVGLIFASFSITSFINSRSYKQSAASVNLEQSSEINRENQIVSFSHPKHDEHQELVYAARLITAVALAALGLQPVLLTVINMSCLGYGLWKISNQKWVKVTQTFPNFQENTPVRIRAYVVGVTGHYFFPVIPDRRNEASECMICLDETNSPQKPKAYFCSHKSYHVACLVPMFFRNSPRWLNDWRARRVEKEERNKDGRVVRRYAEYPSSIPRNNLPSCPDCRGKPIVDHQLYFMVRDASYGDSESGLVALRDPPEAKEAVAS